MIEDIKIGDWVLSDDPNTPGGIEYKQVLQTFNHDTTNLVDIFINGEKITTTDSHPFWVQDVGWVAARDLYAGYHLQTKNESWLSIDKVEAHTGLTTVYNFEVAGFHTYFVSDLGLLVHNDCPTLPGGSGGNYDKVNGQGIYALKDENGAVKYIGRGDAPSRLNVHSTDTIKGNLEGDILYQNNLTKAEAKGLEQRLMDHFGGAQINNPSTPLFNKYNSYSPSNPNAQKYRNAATDELFQEALKRLGG